MVLLGSVLSASHHPQLIEPFLYYRDDIKCFTDLPFGVINLPRSFERRALQRYRLRACDHYLLQRARDGRVLEDELEFLPVALIEMALGRVRIALRGYTPRKVEQIKELPKPKQTRESLLSQIDALGPAQKTELKSQIDLIVKQWRRGRSGELALFFSTYLLMYKLHKLSERVPPAASPCLITLEDDAVVALSFLHSQTLRDLCLSSMNTDAWQLMWYRHHYDYRDVAQRHRQAYNLDGIADYDKHYFTTHGVMWRTANMTHQLDVITLDHNGSEVRPWLNCTRKKCVTDAFDTVVTNIKVPVTPWIGNPVLDHSTGLHSDQFLNHRFSVKAISATMYSFEWYQFGTAAAMMKLQSPPYDESGQDVLWLYKALKLFQLHPSETIGGDIYDEAQPGRWVFDLEGGR